jgi:hypothetical protein
MNRGNRGWRRRTVSDAASISRPRHAWRSANGAHAAHACEQRTVIFHLLSIGG